MSKKCCFRIEWINNPNFSWLREVPDDRNMAFCILCKLKFCLSNMGLTAVNSHKKGKKHQLREKSYNSSKCLKNIFFVKSSASESKMENTATEIDIQSSSTIHQSSDIASEQHETVNMKTCHSSTGIKKFLFKDNVTKSEIMWCLQSIMTHRSLRSAEKDIAIFPTLFPDSDIARSMQLGRDKMAYTIVYAIAPYFKEKLNDDLFACSQFVVGFDESINKVSQNQQMDLNVRFWCPKENEVKTRYFNSSFLGRTRSSDLLSSFKYAIQPLDLKKILQVSMDGPNVNKKFFRELSDTVKETPEDPEILNIGSCGIHAVNVAFKSGATSTEWNLSEFHRSLYYLFKESPARRAMFTSYTNSAIFPLKFCSIRWLENVSVTERSISMIPFIKIFIDEVERNKMAPLSKSYKRVKIFIQDMLLPSKLAFFRLLATEIESFLREYQTDVPLIPYLYLDLCNLIRKLMERFIKKDALKKNVMNIDLEDTSNFLTFKEIDIGISTQYQLKKVKVSDAELNSFRNECRTFLINCTKKLKERSPLIYELTKAVSCFDPRICVAENIFSKRLTKLLLILCNKNWVSTTVADGAKSQFKDICFRSHVICKFKSFKKSGERIDHFWRNLLITEGNCCDALSIIKLVMIFSHGNANLERGFSINSDCLWENMKEESLISRRIVYDGVLASGGLETFNIPKLLVLYARNARAKFAEARKRQYEEGQKKNTQSKLRRETELEVKELQRKKAKLLEEAQRESEKLEEKITSLRLLQKKKKFKLLLI